MIDRIQSKLIGVARRALGRSASLTYLPEDLFPDDVFLVSYPKSGNTWLRFMLASYITGQACDFTNYHLSVPDIHSNPEQCSVIPRPRFIKSHMPFVPEYKKVAYLVRDGRDIAVSYYFHAIKHRNIDRNMAFAEYLRRFNRARHPIPPAFGLWSAHVNGWLDNAPEHFLLMRYEDLKRDPLSELVRLLVFAGVSVDHDAARRAIEAADFQRVKTLEQEQHDQIKALAGSDPSVPFVRSGKVGEADRFFTEALVEQFVAIHGVALRRLGYLP